MYMKRNSWSDYPHLLVDLDMSKNKNHTFKSKPCSVLELSVGTNNKIDWKCITCNHEWKAQGGERKIGTGCPACVNLAINNYDSRNSMAKTHPELAKEYQGDATKVIAGTYKKLPWKCITCEHEWPTSGNSRVNGSGCAACAGQRLHSDGRNSMAMTHPELAKEYQGDANFILAGTHKKLPWKCSTCNHKWNAAGSQRASLREAGCPACANLAINNYDGRNSMAMTHPDLASEYRGDATKVTAGTHKKLDWICKTCEHNWNVGGDSRVQGSGCPACANQVVNNFDGRNSMAMTHPDLAKEYRGDSTLVVAGVARKLHWKCITCEHGWNASGDSRMRGRGCPACNNKVINNFDGRNSMFNTHPLLAEEYQDDATNVIAGTNKKLDWKCVTCYHIWNTAGQNRVQGTGCPSCSNKVINNYDSRNSMFNTHPELAKEYQGDSNLIVAGGAKKLLWNCITCENEWMATGDKRVRLKRGCPACAGQRLHSDGRNSMYITHPELAKEYQGDANLIMAGTATKLLWKCITCENEWKTTGSSRKFGAHGCPACAGQRLHSDGRNSMYNKHPHLAKEYQGDANLIIAGTNKKLDWKCITCEHEWNTTGNSRASSNTDCPACINHVINNYDGRNSLFNTHPQLAIEYQGDSKLVMVGTNKKLDWKCSTCEHEWRAAGCSRNKGVGCPACFGRIHSDGRNSMFNTHPDLALEYQGDATKVVAGTHKKLDWKCVTCNYKWKARGTKRVIGNGCPACANSGYDPSQIGYVYIHQYIDETNHWLKCGITGKPTDRFKQLSRAASRVNIEVEQLDIYTFDDGWIAQQCEQELLNSLELRFNSEYDIDGKAEFFKYSALDEIRNIIGKYL
jgi:DNA-directed RNA polymerase subunit RPC12/RpoP